MVKNTKGGSRHKKMARKNLKEETTPKHTRFIQDENEMYAVVSKMCGNGMCEVECNDMKKRLCIIRNKFRGRNKKSSMLSLGSIILIGLREWEGSSTRRLPKCDLLEVYDGREVSQLKKDPKYQLQGIVDKVLGTSTYMEDDELGIAFSDGEEDTIAKARVEKAKTKTSRLEEDEKEIEKAMFTFDEL